MASTRNARAARVVIGAGLLAGSLLLTPLTAGASPQFDAPNAPLTSAQVITKLDQLAVANDKLTEAFNKATADLASAQRASQDAQRAATAADLALATARHNLALSLAAQYKGASFSHTAALLASNSGQNYIEKMQSLNYLTMHQQEIAQEASVATAQAQQAEATAAKLLAQISARRDALAKQRTHLNDEISKQKALLASLTAVQRTNYLAQGTPSQTQLASINFSTSQGESAAAQKAVSVALAQRGKPYVWGASGPDSFDCSGLTMYAWGQAGVSLPHQSEQQQNMGMPVDISHLLPGDLVFFGSPAYHVGMYIGNGMMVHAPTSGEDVKVVSLSVMSDYSGARRVG